MCRIVRTCPRFSWQIPHTWTVLQMWSKPLTYHFSLEPIQIADTESVHNANASNYFNRKWKLQLQFPNQNCQMAELCIYRITVSCQIFYTWITQEIRVTFKCAHMKNIMLWIHFVPQQDNWPSQKNISHSLSTDVQGRVLEKTHMNHSVMYSTGVTWFFSRCLWATDETFRSKLCMTYPSICIVSYNKIDA